MSADIVGAMVTLLKSLTDITDLVGDRVFGIELPDEEAASMPRMAIVIRPAGGVSPVGGFVKHTAARFDVISWGETPFESDRLGRAVFKALKQARRQKITAGDHDVLFHWAEDAGGRIPVRDGQTNWPASTQPFQIFHAIEAAA